MNSGIASRKALSDSGEDSFSIHVVDVLEDLSFLFFSAGTVQHFLESLDHGAVGDVDLIGPIGLDGRPSGIGSSGGGIVGQVVASIERLRGVIRNSFTSASRCRCGGGGGPRLGRCRMDGNARDGDGEEDCFEHWSVCSVC